MIRLFISATREKLARHFTKTALLCGMLLLSMLTAWQAWSEVPTGEPPGRHLTIIKAFLDFNDQTITIMGQDFDFGPQALEVTLGDFGSLDIVSATSTMIVVDFPEFEMNGDYLLTVSRADGESQRDTYDFTVPVNAAPAGAVMFFDGEECPPEWSPFPPAQGRVLVGLVEGGTLNGTVGDPLTNEENRPHAHMHNHLPPKPTSDDGKHDHSGVTGKHFPLPFVGSFPDITFVTNLPLVPHDHTISENGTHMHTVAIPEVTSTDQFTSNVIPYIQLLICKKDPRP